MVVSLLFYHTLMRDTVHHRVYQAKIVNSLWEQLTTFKKSFANLEIYIYIHIYSYGVVTRTFESQKSVSFQFSSHITKRTIKRVFKLLARIIKWASELSTLTFKRVSELSVHRTKCTSELYYTMRTCFQLLMFGHAKSSTGRRRGLGEDSIQGGGMSRWTWMGDRSWPLSIFIAEWKWMKLARPGLAFYPVD